MMADRFWYKKVRLFPYIVPLYLLHVISVFLRWNIHLQTNVPMESDVILQNASGSTSASVHG